MASFMQGFDDVDVSDHDLVAPEHIRRALMAGELVFADGTTQVFEADGGTTYVENGAIVGLRFTELGRGSHFDGRFRL